MYPVFSSYLSGGEVQAVVVVAVHNINLQDSYAWI